MNFPDDTPDDIVRQINFTELANFFEVCDLSGAEDYISDFIWRAYELGKEAKD